MIINNFNQINLGEFEFTIIGSGPAGITLSLELAKKNKKVLLIEAGGSSFSNKSQSFYKGEVIGDKYFDLEICRLRYLGGSTGHWGGDCGLLDEVDFDKWVIKRNAIDVYEKKTKEILNIKSDFYKERSEFKEFDKIKFLNSDLSL